MVQTLSRLADVSAVRQRVAEGRASAREVDDVISKSVRVAIDSTRRIIRVCTEVTAMRALATSSVATRETIWPSVVTGATLCQHG